MPIKCYFLLEIINSPSLLALVEAGELIIDGCHLCDWMVPLTRGQVNGQNITCVGPESEKCPDPKSAKIV